MSISRQFSALGFALAIGSAASFALSGIFASALLTAGWSPGAATTTRISLSALILLPPTLIMLRGKWDLVRSAWAQILLFGLLAVAGCQLAFFMAIQFIPPSLALLIEFMGPVILMLWIWGRTRTAPSKITMLGAVIAVLGVAAISGVATGASLHPLGIIFALIAAVGLAAYFATGASTEHGIAPLPFVGLGLLVASIVLIVVSAIGILPFTVTDSPTVVAGTEVAPALVVSGMVLMSTVFAYLLGVSASRRLGATVASFTGYAEPIFAIIWTILLLAITPTGLQWVGAALIITGVVAVKVGDVVSAQKLQPARKKPERVL
ncbi:MAG TPA: EamA family transporter [Microbacteriaceae bacterium]|nr:EamA family transporter [Microbacteriaceae bacterium]